MENANNVHKKSRGTSEAIALSFTRMSSNQTNIRKSLQDKQRAKSSAVSKFGGASEVSVNSRA